MQAVKSGKMGLKRSVGPVEARVLFRPDGSSCVQLATPLYDGFTDWATLTHNPAARSPARRFHVRPLTPALGSTHLCHCPDMSKWVQLCPLCPDGCVKCPGNNDTWGGIYLRPMSC